MRGYKTNSKKGCGTILQQKLEAHYSFEHRLLVLATAIRKNANTKGIYVNNVKIKLSQYADDTTLILHGSRESLLSSLAMLDDFMKVSGLRLNDKKTEGLWIGASIGNSKRLFLGKELKWAKDKVKSLALGI